MFIDGVLHASISIGLFLHSAPLRPCKYSIIYVLALLHCGLIADAPIRRLIRRDGALNHDFSEYVFELLMFTLLQGNARVDLELELLSVLLHAKVF